MNKTVLALLCIAQGTIFALAPAIKSTATTVTTPSTNLTPNVAALQDTRGDVEEGA